MTRPTELTVEEFYQNPKPKKPNPEWWRQQDKARCCEKGPTDLTLEEFKLNPKPSALDLVFKTKSRAAAAEAKKKALRKRAYRADC